MALKLSRLWVRKIANGTEMIGKMNNPNNSTFEIDGPDIELQVEEKIKIKNSMKAGWIMVFNVRAITSITSLAFSTWALLGSIKKIMIFRQTEALANEKLRKGGAFLLKTIKSLYVFLFALLIIGLIAYFEGLHLFNPHLIYSVWLKFWAEYIVPGFLAVIKICVVMFVIQSLDRLVLCLGCMYIKIKGVKPAVTFDYDDPEQALENYPMVLVQIPMFNEKEVYALSISAACQLDWPRERLLVQILDDSDEEIIQEMIKTEVSKWSSKGINIMYEHRHARTGYKAGNLKNGMSFDYVKDYEFVALFDADFQPKPEFLSQTVPHFKDNPHLGLVQARWCFINDTENLLTRLQNINLSFHFEVEQQVHGTFLNFFGFNGTAGVWRIRALEDSGGWLDRTTVEDMDIAVRAHLNGWKFIFLNDVKVPCELPESYEAYRRQQHRWNSGPMQLFRLCLPEIIQSKIPMWKKANLIFLFFVLRKLILPFNSFTLFCIILPLTMFVPESGLPIWVVSVLATLVSFLNILPSPGSLPFVIPYLLLENAMSVTKFNAMLSGLFQFSNSYEWTVTKKSGRALANHDSEDHESEMLEHKKQTPKKVNQIRRKELALALFLLAASAKSLVSAGGLHFYFLLFQGLTFLGISLDLI